MEKNIKLDYKKKYKDLYQPKTTGMLIDIAAIPFLMVDGKGNPNEEDGDYSKAMQLLYGITFTIKMSRKGTKALEGYHDYVVPPLEGQVKIAGERPKHTVMVLLPLGVHGLKLAAEGYVGILAHPQLIEAAGDRPPAAGDLLLHQSGGEGKVFVFSGKAVKGSSGPIQPNRGVGIVVLGGQVDQPGEPGA